MGTYRAIIADDEPKIMQLIRQLGHFEKLGIEIVRECKNGREAYESILELRPDFVLSDIQMPVYDGIELIKRVREAKADPLFVLVSGYRHFEYARTAIALNVMDYLLKPIDEKQLNDTLRLMCARIDERRLQEEQNKTLFVLQKNRQRQAMEPFWAKLIYGGAQMPLQNERSASALEFSSEEACNRRFSTEFFPGGYQVLCIFSNMGAILEKQDVDGCGRIEAYMKESFPKDVVFYANTTYMGHVAVLNFRPEQKGELRQAVLALYYKLRDLREIYGDIRLSIGCSRVCTGPKDLPGAFEEAHAAEWGRLVLSRNSVLEYDQVAQLPRFSIEELVSPGELQTLTECLRYQRMEELSDLFSGLYKRATQLNAKNPQDMMRSFFTLQGQIIGSFEEKELQTRMQEDTYYAYLNAKSFCQAIQNLFVVCQTHIREEQNRMKEKLGKPIRLSVAFVREHYAEQISLEDAALAGNVSPTYLSKLFKSEMQVGFNEFLTQVRLEESQKLLERTNLTIRDIAARVGYPDEKYYSKLFKKNTGIKPTDYRRIYS